MQLHLQQFTVCGKNSLRSIQEGKQGGWRATALFPPPPRAPNAAFCSGGRMEGPWGRPASEVRQPSSVPVYARLSPSRSSRPCQEPSFRSLIISASLPPCICNDLFTSLCQLPLPDRALPKDKGHVVFSFACLLLPHTAWHRLGPGNCMRTSG